MFLNERKLPMEGFYCVDQLRNSDKRFSGSETSLGSFHPLELEVGFLITACLLNCPVESTTKKLQSKDIIDMQTDAVLHEFAFYNIDVTHVVLDFSDVHNKIVQNDHYFINGKKCLIVYDFDHFCSLVLHGLLSSDNVYFYG